MRNIIGGGVKGIIITRETFEIVFSFGLALTSLERFCT
jgi:hypothetical protein